MLDQETLEKLLNRPLTTAEVSNLDTYLDITDQNFANLFCMSFASEDTERTYDVRQGYRTIFTDVFSGVPIVTINGEVQDVTTYSTRQWDNPNGTWFNSIVFKRHLPRYVTEITVDASWGFETLPNDLQLLYAKLFSLLEQSSNTASSQRVQSKRIEDFSVTYATDTSSYDSVVSDSSSVLAKYSLCNQGGIRHGEVNGHIYGL